MDEASAPTLSSLAAQCTSALNEAIYKSRAFQDGIFKLALEDERGRFNVWASNIGALQPAVTVVSLDYRLRDGPLMHKSVSLGLERLSHTTRSSQYGENLKLYAIGTKPPGTASAILDGSAPNRSSSPVPHSQSDEEPDGHEAPTTELEELMLGIHSAISHLFRLSMLIRRQRPKGKLPVLDGFTPLDSSPDISYVTDILPQNQVNSMACKTIRKRHHSAA